VWSPQPVHEPLIPKWLYDALTQKPPVNQGSRTGNTINIHPQTNRTYVLRGMVLHACNRRLFGKHRNGITYCCQPEANNRGRPNAYASHPKTTYIREDLLLKDVARRRHNLLQQAQNCPANDPSATALRHTYNAWKTSESTSSTRSELSAPALPEQPTPSPSFLKPFPT
jgi:hypothetical protein